MSQTIKALTKGIEPKNNKEKSAILYVRIKEANKEWVEWLADEHKTSLSCLFDKIIDNLKKEK